MATNMTETTTETETPMRPAELAARVGWIAARLVLAYLLMSGFQPFFYQAF